MDDGLWMPILTTERLTVRSYTMDDSPYVSQIEDKQQRHAWLTWTVANYRQLALLWQPPYGDRAIVLTETDEVIGSVGLVQSWGPFHLLPSLRRADEPAKPVCSPEMGLFWTVAREHRNRGYATEAARVMIGYTFETLNARRVVATTEHDNLASQAVMRKLGMTIDTYPDPEPTWFQTVGILINPKGK